MIIEIINISVIIKDSRLVSFLFLLAYLSHSYFSLSLFFSLLTFKLSKRSNSVMSQITVITVTVTISCNMSER